eukprot:GEZU01009040.1.p1 GENE.GEZU01009040.1~~GEZU01009040.1.p1  ORF type:complete len:194 (-),score=42.27 GEZU01009040.1:193-774(-)
MAENTTRDTLIHYIFDDVDDDDDYLYSANNKRVIDSDNNESYEYETHTPSPKRRSPTRGDREEKSYASRLDHLKRKRRDLEEFIQRKEREKRSLEEDLAKHIKNESAQHFQNDNNASPAATSSSTPHDGIVFQFNSDATIIAELKQHLLSSLQTKQSPAPPHQPAPCLSIASPSSAAKAQQAQPRRKLIRPTR